MAGITDHPDMTLAVDHAPTQESSNKQIILNHDPHICMFTEVADVVANGAEKIADKVEPVVDSVVKSVTKTIAGAVKLGSKEGGPLLNAIKDVAKDNAAPA